MSIPMMEAGEPPVLCTTVASVSSRPCTGEDNAEDRWLVRTSAKKGAGRSIVARSARLPTGQTGQHHGHDLVDHLAAVFGRVRVDLPGAR
jgi:hypothetical protein